MPELSRCTRKCIAQRELCFFYFPGGDRNRGGIRKFSASERSSSDNSLTDAMAVDNPPLLISPEKSVK